MRGTRDFRKCMAPLAVAAVVAAAPAAAQRAELPARVFPAAHADGTLTPRQIAARAQAAVLVVYAMGADGDTVAAGTGFAISADGLFATNFHVVEAAHALRVESLDGRRLGGVRLVAADAPHDLAVLRVEGAGLHPLPLGRDDQAQLGDDVYVMGNPLGMNGTFTDGMVSGKRPVEGVSMLQISAPISPGSSGGPVMNGRGEVIGVATLILSGGQNINLAVPVRYLRSLLAGAGAGRPISAAAVPRGARSGLAALRDPSPAEGSMRRRGRALSPHQQVLQQLDAFGRMLAGRGYVAEGAVWTGELPRGEGAGRSLRFEAGSEYLVSARCDVACSDLDLAIVDEAGNRLAVDVAPDDFPTLVVRPATSGTYQIVTVMAACRAPACTFGASVFRR